MSNLPRNGPSPRAVVDAVPFLPPWALLPRPCLGSPLPPILQPTRFLTCAKCAASASTRTTAPARAPLDAEASTLHREEGAEDMATMKRAAFGRHLRFGLYDASNIGRSGSRNKRIKLRPSSPGESGSPGAARRLRQVWVPDAVARFVGRNRELDSWAPGATISHDG